MRALPGREAKSVRVAQERVGLTGLGRRFGSGSGGEWCV